MHLGKHFGDSYDIVKKSLLQWLTYFGDWAVHPMFTQEETPQNIRAYELMLGAQVISTERLTSNRNRNSYFEPITKHKNVFIDPDTGVGLKIIGGKKAPNFIFSEELMKLVEARPDSLTMVFDQSIAHSSDEERMKYIEGKLAFLRRQDVFGFCYVSHACFLIVSKNYDLIERARDKVIEASQLPPRRFTKVIK